MCAQVATAVAEWGHRIVVKRRGFRGRIKTLSVRILLYCRRALVWIARATWECSAPDERLVRTGSASRAASRPLSSGRRSTRSCDLTGWRHRPGGGERGNSQRTPSRLDPEHRGAGAAHGKEGRSRPGCGGTREAVDATKDLKAMLLLPRHAAAGTRSAKRFQLSLAFFGPRQ